MREEVKIDVIMEALETEGESTSSFLDVEKGEVCHYLP